MKKLTVHIIRFTLLFLVAFLLLASWASYNPDLESKVFSSPSFHGGTSLRVPDLVDWIETKTDKSKMLFLGPSTLYRGLNPDIISDDVFTVFNGGSSGQRLMNSYQLLKFSNSNDDLGVVVLDVFPRIWNRGDGVESSRDFIVNNPEFPSLEFAKMAVYSRDVRNCYLAAFYSIKRGLFKQKTISVNEVKEDKYLGNGFIFTEDSKSIRARNPLSEKTNMNRQEKRWFRKIKGYCEANEIKLIVLIPPEVYPTEFENPFEEGLLFINAQQAPIDSNLFYDNHHLYGVGAAVYSSWLKEQLNPLLEE